MYLGFAVGLPKSALPGGEPWKQTLMGKMGNLRDLRRALQDPRALARVRRRSLAEPDCIRRRSRTGFW